MKFLNFGSCNVDYVYSLDHIVRIGETQSCNSMKVFAGGKGLNQSIALSRAGEKVYHAGCVGADGDMLLDVLRDNGVDISYVKRVKEKNGHAIIQVSRDAENSIFIYPGSNAMVTMEYVDEVLSHFERGDVLLLQNEINCLEYIIEQASTKGMFILLNPSPINETVFAIDLDRISCIVLNEGELQDISGKNTPEEGLACLLEKHKDLRIMLTLGKDGCIYQDASVSVYCPIFETVAVDTTAAGDTFTGYFAAELAKGTDMKKALRLASCAAAIAVSKHGAAPSIPLRHEVVSAMSTMRMANVDRHARAVLRQIQQYVEEHLATASLNDLARLLGYSTVYMGTLVKKATGLSFKKLLQDKRLSVAADLLSTTDLPIGEIIRSVGYENEHYFREKFKERYSQNPLAYRKIK